MCAWIYDPGKGKKKHAWAKDEAGFEPSEKGPVGKCPGSITPAKAEELLNQGFPVYEDEGSDVPSRIYNVYMGVIYEARRTEYGKSFHGFPWRGDMAIGRRIPAGVRKRLEDRARENNEWRELKRWIKNFG